MHRDYSDEAFNTAWTKLVGQRGSPVPSAKPGEIPLEQQGKEQLERYLNNCLPYLERAKENALDPQKNGDQYWSAAVLWWEERIAYLQMRVRKAKSVPLPRWREGTNIPSDVTKISANPFSLGFKTPSTKETSGCGGVKRRYTEHISSNESPPSQSESESLTKPPAIRPIWPQEQDRCSALDLRQGYSSRLQMPRSPPGNEKQKHTPPASPTFSQTDTEAENFTFNDKGE